MSDVVYEAPRAGTWQLDSTHLQRPVSGFAMSLFRSGMIRGFSEGCARYGLLLDHLEPEAVNGFVYMRQAMFGADGSATPEQFEARIRTSAQAFEQKQWRSDLDHWDQVDRPAAIRAHRAIEAVDPATLSDEELAAHLVRCAEHVEAMYYLHHKYTVTSTIATGDFLAAAQAWTGVPVGELMELLRGSSQISTGFAAAELHDAAEAIRASAAAADVLAATGPPGTTLDALGADPDAGAAVRAYLDAVRHRSVGYDVGELTAGELPELLVATLRAALDGAAAAPTDFSRLDEIWARVPAEHRTDFTARLAEAQLVNRLRDERGVYSDGWGVGLARRTLLEVGRRLHAAGRLADAEHAVEATATELVALLRGEPGPNATELARRHEWRTTHTTEDAPPMLGPPPDPPPPLETLPPPARRGVLAVGISMASLFGVSEAANTDRVLRGLPVNPGSYEGTARVVRDAADFGRVRAGDVLVARTTSPYFNVVLPLLGAIVTDRGGQLCHAAIVAREYGIPGIVGTREATQRIPDGARVQVDGRTGEVRLLG